MHCQDRIVDGTPDFLRLNSPLDSENNCKIPTRKPDVWATQFISLLGVRATRPFLDSRLQPRDLFREDHIPKSGLHGRYPEKSID
jgi:hypothetical protein